MLNLVYLFKFLPLDMKTLSDITLHLRLVRMTCKSMVFITTDVKILSVDRVSFESHQRCLLPSPAKKCPFETVPRASKDSVGRGSGLPSECRMRGTLMMIWDL